MEKKETKIQISYYEEILQKVAELISVNDGRTGFVSMGFSGCCFFVETSAEKITFCKAGEEGLEFSWAQKLAHDYCYNGSDGLVDLIRLTNDMWNKELSEKRYKAMQYRQDVEGDINEQLLQTAQELSRWHKYAIIIGVICSIIGFIVGKSI